MINSPAAWCPMSANVLPTGGAPPPLTEQELSDLTVSQLEKLLQDKGLARGGKKVEKIRRYLTAQANGFQPIPKPPKPVATASERKAKSRKRTAKSRKMLSQQRRQEINANNAKQMARVRASMTPDEKQCMNAKYAKRKAQVRADMTPDEKQRMNAKDAEWKAQVRAEEKENIRNNQPSFDGTMVWEEPGVDYTLDRHEESPATAAFLFNLNNGSYADWKLVWPIAYMHLRIQLKNDDNVTALERLDSLYLLSVKRYERFDKTVCQIFDKPFMRDARNLQEKLDIIDFEVAQLMLFVSKSISIDQLEQELVTPREIDTNNLKKMYNLKWMESLVGLRLKVEQKWWVDPVTRQSIGGATLWPGKIYIGTDDDGSRCFVFKCDDENYPKMYRIEYCDIKKYVDKEHPDFSNFTLREKPLYNNNFEITCEETLQELREFDGRPLMLLFAFSYL